MPKALYNQHVDTLSLPPVPLVQKWGRSYSGDYGPLLDLSQAVPGYPPHVDILTWLAEAAGDARIAGYGPIEGEDDLRREYASHVSSLYQTAIYDQNVHITSGCNQAFISALMVVAGNGDTVLLSNPFYFNHETSLNMLGIKAAFYNTDAETGFLPDLSSLRNQMSGNVKAIVLISPNNPTGAIYPPSLLEEIFDLCQQKGIWMILDETYRDFLDPEIKYPHTLFSRPTWQENFIQLYSFSKSFCIPGHRLGAVLGGEETVQQFAKVMDNLQICAPRAPQAAVAKALPALVDWREKNREEIARRSTCLGDVMQHSKQWKIKAQGAYFAYVEHPFKGISSIKVAEKLASKAGVTSIPGEFFGPKQERYLRIAFANADTETLKLLPERLNLLERGDFET
ncbi:MAG: aminotransferase [Sneathiellales bacterium]|nr:aminotransferase [Sneathiellales bacterium]